MYETKQRKIPYTVCVPKYETRQREIQYTVYNTVREERVRTENYTVLVPEHYTKTITVKGGHWETRSVCVPGPKMRKLVRQPGCWKYDKSRGKCVYKPGKCRIVCIQCPPKTICKKVWVPTCETKEICCKRYRRECRSRDITYTVCKRVPETRTRICEYQVCKMVPEQREKVCNYTVRKLVPETKTREINYTTCKMVCEKRTKTQNYQVCKMVKEKRTKQVNYTTCKMVCEQRSKTTPYRVCKMVPETRTRTCSYRVCKMVPEIRTKTVCETRCRQECFTDVVRVKKCRRVCEPYTVVRCVPRVVCRQVPIEIRCPTPCCEMPCFPRPIRGVIKHLLQGCACLEEHLSCEPTCAAS